MEDHKKVIRFLVLVFTLCIAWFVLYDVYLSQMDDWLTENIADVCVVLLNLAGYEAVSNKSVISIAGQELVYIGPSCNGMILMALFAGFIIAFPGPFISKLFFIPLGIVVINLLNIFRVMALTLNSLYSFRTLDFNHKYTFSFIVYAFIFALWILWVKKFSSLKNLSFNSAPQHADPYHEPSKT